MNCSWTVSVIYLNNRLSFNIRHACLMAIICLFVNIFMVLMQAKPSFHWCWFPWSLLSTVPQPSWVLHASLFKPCPMFSLDLPSKSVLKSNSWCSLYHGEYILWTWNDFLSLGENVKCIWGSNQKVDIGLNGRRKENSWPYIIKQTCFRKPQERNKGQLVESRHHNVLSV